MRRAGTLEDFSDGKLYDDNDMVKADCHGCKGCSDCCRDMGESVLLDPYDAYRLTVGLGRPFADFLEKEIGLGVVDGYILPHLRMAGEGGACAFLDPAGRCGVHALRPGVCRLFPMGRYYENGVFRYFVQSGVCRATRSKVKASKWVDTPDQGRYRSFVTDWHYLLNGVEERLKRTEDDMFRRELNMLLLKTFYLAPYDGVRDFYEQFGKRKEEFHAFTP